MTTRDTDNEFLGRRNLLYIYCESDFEYERKAGYINTCEPEYSKEELGKLGNYLLNFIIVDRVVDFFNIFFSRARTVLINIKS